MATSVPTTAAALPYALLLTDVVDSTRLAERLGDEAAAALWSRHDRLARDLLPQHRGREIDKTDGMLLLFEQAVDAVAYALAYHRALATLVTPEGVALAARAGLHVGPVVLRENDADDVARGAKPLEVDGLAKPMAARVMALATGGQTLLSGDAMADFTRLPAGPAGAAPAAPALVSTSHGHWLLKGVAEPIELFELAAPGGTFTAPHDGDKAWRVARRGARWVPVAEVPNNLPQQLNSFVGREREIATLKSLLAQHRMATLLGMGGLGKTRLSLQVATELMPLFPDGVWFVDLAPIRDAALVAAEAAQVLGLREEPGRPLTQTLAAHLHGQRTLLILDNCEHLLQSAAALAHTLLRAAPGLRLLASSREALHVPGEQLVAVQPLPLPPRLEPQADGPEGQHEAQRAALQAAQRSVAVQLFIDRAKAHKPGFELTAREAPALVELVSRLEGIPLALELAAARLRVLPVAEINLRLKDRYKLLTGGGKVLLERQQTLRGLVDWSYELLGEDEQVLLQRTAVFAGGFELDAAEGVCGAAPLDPLDVMDRLASLVEKSLVMLDESGERPRYRMLETIREYALEKLGAGEERQAAAARHCEFFFNFAKAGKQGLLGPEQAEWIWRLEAEHDNLRAAMASARSGVVDPFIAVKLAVALQGFWILRGYCSEGRNLVLAALELPAIQASELAQSHALYVGATLAESQGDHAEAAQMLDTCLALRRRLGNPNDLAATLSTLAMARLAAGAVDIARTCEEEALALFRALGHAHGEMISLQHLGEVALHAGDRVAAHQRLAESTTLAQRLAHQEVLGENELLLGELALLAGDTAAAAQRFARSLAISRDAGNRRGQAQALWWLGRAELDAGDLAASRRRLDEALRAFRSFEMHEHALDCLEDHAALALDEAKEATGLQLAAAASGLRERLGLRRAPWQAARWQQLLVRLDRSQPAWVQATEWDLAQAARVALGAAARTEVSVAA